MAIPFRVRAGVEQHSHNFKVSFANGKVNWRSIEVAIPAPVRIIGKQTAHGRRVSGIGRREDFPGDVINIRWSYHAAQQGFEFIRISLRINSGNFPIKDFEGKDGLKCPKP